MTRQFGVTRRTASGEQLRPGARVPDTQHDNVIHLSPKGMERTPHSPLARRTLADTPVPRVRRAFSFARDLFAALVWIGFGIVAAVCLLIPGFVFGWVLFLQ